MLGDILTVLAFVAIWLLLAPCSPFSLWKGACAWKPKARPATPPDATIKPPETP